MGIEGKTHVLCAKITLPEIVFLPWKLNPKQFEIIPILLIPALHSHICQDYCSLPTLDTDQIHSIKLQYIALHFISLYYNAIILNNTD